MPGTSLPQIAMNVRFQSDALQATPTKKVDTVRSDSAAARGATSNPSATAAETGSNDRVEISAEGRARAADSTAPMPLELEVARVALRAGQSLSESRLHELRERVRTGYYDTPSSVDRIGEAVARDLIKDA